MNKIDIRAKGKSLYKGDKHNVHLYEATHIRYPTSSGYILGCGGSGARNTVLCTGTDFLLKRMTINSFMGLVKASDPTFYAPIGVRSYAPVHISKIDSDSYELLLVSYCLSTMDTKTIFQNRAIAYGNEKLWSLSHYATSAVGLVTTLCQACTNTELTQTHKFSISQFGYCPTCLGMQLWYQEATGGYFF